ncbi:tetraspanin [Plakobranchus ocellatus]|uniref:Tetraspanin n=1 Tax=Plakobranchus ocellatus TaxID=259542 RepID=A0AAV4C8U6_9GAST|nr:tetraspanin [Plakobranchus ocellatus]
MIVFLFSSQQDIGEMLIGFHGVYLLCVFMYMSYPVHAIQFTLPIGSLLTGVIAFAEVSVVNIAFAPSLIDRAEIKDDLVLKLRKDYFFKGNNDFSISYDYFSIWLQCCGISDRSDFQTAGLERQKGKTKVDLQVAPTCCEEKLFSVASGLKVDQCIESGETNIYQIGCFSKLVDYIKKMCKYYAIVIWIHLVDCCIHSYLYKQRVTYLVRVMDYKAEKQREAAVRHSQDQRGEEETTWVRFSALSLTRHKYSTLNMSARARNFTFEWFY